MDLSVLIRHTNTYMAIQNMHVGVKAIISDEQRGILLIRHVEGYWDVPGGRVDDDEDLDQTLRREISEELPGVVVHTIGGVLDAHRVHKEIEPDTSLVLILFRVDARVPAVLQLSDEHEDYLWLKKPSDVPTSDIDNGLRTLMQRLLK